MGSPIRVLVDLDVILDVLQRREPFYQASAEVLARAESGSIEGWVAAHSVTTLCCLYAKYQSAEQARVRIRDLLGVLQVAAVDQAAIEQALMLSYGDFEDAVQMAAAVRVKAQYLITRNVRDYRTGPLAALQPAELLALL